MASSLYALRQAAGLTRRQLAEAVGVTPGAIENIEKDRHKPSVELAARIEGKLGQPIFDRSRCECGCGAEIVGTGFAHNHAARGGAQERVAQRLLSLLELLGAGHTREAAAARLGVSRSQLFADVAELRRQGLLAPRPAARARPVRPRDTISASAAARLVRLDRKKVGAMCDVGELPATRFGREWAIDATAAADLAEQLGVELWSLREAERRTALPRAFLADRLPTYPGGSRGARRVEPRLAQELAAHLAAQPDRCQGCDQPVDPARTWCDSCRVASDSQRAARQAASTAWWEGLSPDERTAFVEKRAASRTYSRRDPDVVIVSCWACGTKYKKERRKADSNEAAKRRNVCGVCGPIWSGGLLAARRAVRPVVAPTNRDAFRAALAVGRQTQEAIRDARPPKFGRQPRKIDRAIMVEVLHVDRRMSDGEIRNLWRFEVEPVNEAYVTRLRQESRIRRRRQRV